MTAIPGKPALANVNVFQTINSENSHAKTRVDVLDYLHEALNNSEGGGNSVSSFESTRQEMMDALETTGFSFPQWLVSTKETATNTRGVYNVPAYTYTDDETVAFYVGEVEMEEFIPTPSDTNKTPSDPNEILHERSTSIRGVPILETDLAVSMVPDRDDNFRGYGAYAQIRNIISSGFFCPIYITGESGNGKTKMVEQVGAETNREVIRVNITGLTDEDDLLGGFRLVNGETVWQHGPVVEAMIRGAILLLDEIDLGTPRMMCLQPVLEGNSIFLKKIGQTIRPAKGFTVIATANTKGHGEGMKFVGTNLLNEAFLDRFPVMISHDYPSIVQERKILKEYMRHLDLNLPDTLTEAMLNWADTNRKAYKSGSGGVDYVITTRRLLDLIKLLKIQSLGVKDRVLQYRTHILKTVELLTERFPGEAGKTLTTTFDAHYTEQKTKKQKTKNPNGDGSGSNEVTSALRNAQSSNR